MIELLYGVGPHITRADGKLIIIITPFSKKMHQRPIKLIEGLEWLRSIGLITELTIRRYDIELSLKSPADTNMAQANQMCEVDEIPEKSCW